VQRGRRSQVQIVVADRGAGIPADELPHIFEPFYRGQHAVGRQIHGNGLGLSLVHRIVRAHGGTVSVRSREHEGTTFTITLPAEPMDPRSTALHGDAAAPAH
jgi:signal transduction histidine kinase